MPQLESPHAANYRAHTLWSPCATITEPTHSGAHAPQLERSPHAATKDPACHNEDPTCCNETQHSQKKQKGISHTTPKAQVGKEKIDMLDFTNIKNFCVSNVTTKKVKRQPIE